MAWGPTTGEASDRLRRVTGTNTRPEVVVRRIAHALGYRFRLHRRDLPGRPDLVFPGRRKVVFVHGCFWHRHRCRAGRSSPSANARLWEEKFRRNVARDRAAVRELRAIGWEPLVVWECETRKAGLERLAECLAEFLGPGTTTRAVPSTLSGRPHARP